MSTAPAHHESKAKLLDAALQVIRAKGYSATTIDDICYAAGLTKGSFFHHFRSKQDLALAATTHFSQMAGGLFAAAAYQNLPDPVDRLLGYIDFRKAILRGELPNSPAYSAPWCKRPTRRIRLFARLATPVSAVTPRLWKRTSQTP